MSFAQKLTQIMAAKNLTTTELGRMLGVSQGTISRWKNGVTEPYERQYVPLAHALGITIDELKSKGDASIVHTSHNPATISDTQALMALVADLAAQVASQNKTIAGLCDRIDRSQVAIDRVEAKLTAALPPPPPPPSDFPKSSRSVPPPKAHKLA